jgi:hypothetical protein
MLPGGAFILGVDSHTALVLDLERGVAAVSGLGGVTIRVGGRGTVLPSGSEVPIGTLAEVAEGLAAGRTVDIGWEPRGRRSPRSGDVGDASRAAGSSVRDDMVRDEGTFVDAIGRGDTRTAVGALLDLDSAISARLRAGEDSPDLDNASATFQALIARLGEQAADGTRDPRATLEPLVTTLLDLRARARDAQDWESADFIRDRLVAAGIEIHDAAEGSTWTLGHPPSE